jgi:hypothetical protein
LAARQSDQFSKFRFRKTDKPIAVVNGNEKHADPRLEKTFDKHQSQPKQFKKKILENQFEIFR